jgi:hypothetical protein
VHPDLTASVFTFTLHPTSTQSAEYLSAAHRRAQHTAVCPMCAFAARHFLKEDATFHGDQTRSPCKSVSGTLSYSCSCSLEATSAEHSTPRLESAGHGNRRKVKVSSLPGQSPTQHAHPNDKSSVVQQFQRASSGLSKGSALFNLSRRLWESIPCPHAHAQQQQQEKQQRAHSESKRSTDSLLCSTPSSQLMDRSDIMPYTAVSTMPKFPTTKSPSCVSGGALSDSAMELGSSSGHSISSHTDRRHAHRRQEAQRRWRLLRTHVWVTDLEQGLRKSMWESACTVALKSLAPVASSGGESFCSMPSSPATSTAAADSESSNMGVGDDRESEAVASSFGGRGMSVLAVLTAH